MTGTLGKFLAAGGIVGYFPCVLMEEAHSALILV
jgi:hypothetical protein